MAQVAYRVLAVLLAVKDGENEAHGTLEPLPLLAVSAAFGCKFLGHRWEGAQTQQLANRCPAVARQAFIPLKAVAFSFNWKANSPAAKKSK